MIVNARNNEAITVNGLALEDVEKFNYLGATVGIPAVCRGKRRSGYTKHWSNQFSCMVAKHGK